jgi:hypothetical protein
MATSLESKREQTEPSTQDLPTIPTVQEMKAWDEEKVLRWIQQRDRNILKDNNLNNFKQAGIHGRAFLAFSVDLFKSCGLSLACSVALQDLVDEVKEGKFNLKDT